MLSYLYSYLQWIMQQTASAGTRMQILQNYVLARDAEKNTLAEPAHRLPRPGKCYIHAQLSAMFMYL